MRVKQLSIAALILTGLLCTALRAADDASAAADDEGPDRAAILRDVASRAVTLRYYLKYDKGRSPFFPGDAVSPGPYGRMSGVADSDTEELLAEQRPLESLGLPLSASEILTSDLGIEDRFIEKITVVHGDREFPARIDRVGAEFPAAVLKLDSPMPELRPLEFAASVDDEELYVVSAIHADANWVYVLAPLSDARALAYGKVVRKAPSTSSVIVNANGSVVTVNYRDFLDEQGAWRACPADWAFISSKSLAESRKRIRAAFDASVFVTRLNFRSPPKTAGRNRYYGDEDEQTELYAAGVILDEQRVLVMAALEPKLTARLERITLLDAEGNETAASFESSLKDYAAFIARLDEPVGKPIVAWQGEPTDLLYDALMGVEFTIQGESMDVDMPLRRIPELKRGFRGQVYPWLHFAADLVLFDFDGRVIALPGILRDRSTESRGYSASSQDMMMAAHLEEVLAGAAAEVMDPDNRPLSETQQNRLAWLGVALQPLDKDLARINKVSAQTDDGDYGCLVSYVYPGSPAAKAGLRLGDVLIRVHAEPWPTPMQVRLEEFIDPSFFMRMWEQLDEIPEEYFDRLPTPWSPAENTLTRALTDLGFGTPFRLEYARGGEVLTQEFTVVQSPAHFAMAPKFQSEALGLTVRDLTYEVRRYFQRPAGEPGVIVARVEPGGRASVSGVKPFEIVTHVNNTPVMNVADFERLAASGDLVLQIKRMTKGRVVSIKGLGGKSDAPGEASSEAPGEAP